MTQDWANNNQRYKLLLPYLLAAIVGFNFFFFTPINLYLGNINEFSSSFINIIQWLLIATFLCILILGLISLVCKKNLKYRYSVFLAAIGILIWLQSNIFVWDYGLLDGRNIDWSVSSWRGWLDLTVWISILTVSIVFYKKIGRIFIISAVLLFIIQLLSVSYETVRNLDKITITQKKQGGNKLKNLANFSPKKNVLHLILDGFQADVFENLINLDGLGKYYRKNFSGFVFYNEALGIFPYTRFAVPAFLTGKVYKNNMVKNDFIVSALKGKSILNAAYKSGYEVDLASEPYFEKLYRSGHHNYSYIIPGNSQENFLIDNVTKLIDLALFRIAPHFLKRYIYNKQNWFLNTYFRGDVRMQHRFFSHSYFIDRLINNMQNSRRAPVYKYIHIMNTHNPMVLNADCSYAGSAIATNRITLTIQSKCTLDLITRLISRMKELNVYDNTLIIMHADHGGWVRPYRFRGQIVTKDGKKIPPWAAALASPLIAIKLPNASGPLRTSSAFASLLDIPDTISDALSLGEKFDGRSILKLKPGQRRSRKFYFYYWQRDAWEAKYTSPIYEFTIDGSLYDTRWKPGRVFYPPRKNK